jgi:pimeloyl-ACP methyl ester carboxylesterase
MKTVYADGFALQVVDLGMGSPLVFAHGFPLDHRMWRRQIERFAATHRVIVPDLRGLGKSVGASGTTAMSRMADDLVCILDALEIAEPVTLCGLSMGGCAAWEFVSRHPGRLSRLIICDARAALDSPDMIRTRMTTADRILSDGLGFLVDMYLPKLIAPDNLARRPDIVESITRMVTEGDPAGVAAALRGLATRSDATSLLPTIAVPTLLIVGEHDAISTADEMRGMAATIPGGQFEVIPEAGHLAPLENPDAVNDAIAGFLGV